MLRTRYTTSNRSNSRNRLAPSSVTSRLVQLKALLLISMLAYVNSSKIFKLYVNENYRSSIRVHLYWRVLPCHGASAWHPLHVQQASQGEPLLFPWVSICVHQLYLYSAVYRAGFQ